MDKTSVKFSFQKRVLSFKYAFSGLVNLVKYEHNARLHMVAGFLVILLGLLIGIKQVEWLILIIMITIVFVSETINSAIESISDFISPEYNLKIKQVKDYAAAAVLIASIASLIVGIIIFLPKIIK